MYYYTLAQARKALVGNSTGAYLSGDIDAEINRAVYALSGLSGWECLRRTVRFLSAGPVFALPQGFAGLVRVCVNGRPSTLRGQDFRFLQSGPGDLRRPPRGFTLVPPRNVQDVGTSPVIFEPSAPFRAFAFADGPVPEDFRVVVTGVRPDGRVASVELVPYQHPSYDAQGALVSGVEPEDAEPAAVEFTTVDEVVLRGEASEYVTLYAADAADLSRRVQLAYYNPRIPVPRFRRYELSGVPPDAPVEVLAEARVDYVPLVRDTDVLPFPAIEPVEWMIRADWAMKSGEPTQAQNYRTQAMNWLKAQEVVEDTVQTQVVVNSVYAGSMGEVSEEADNI